MAPQEPAIGLLDDLKEVILKHRAIAVLGAGVSQAASGNAETAGWRGLLQHGLKYCLDRGRVDQAWYDRKLADLNEGNTDEWILVASAIEQKLGAPNNGDFGNWLDASVGSLELKDRNLVEAILALQLPIFTLNYDRLVEQASEMREITWNQPINCQKLLRGEGEAKILHMHGCYEDRGSVVLGLSSYGRHAHAKKFETLQQAMRMTHSLVFIGCGGSLADPNWGALLEWARGIFGQEESHSHYWIVNNGDITEAKRKEYRQYRIELIGYGDKHEDLPGFLKNLPSTHSNRSSIDVKEKYTIEETQLRRYCKTLQTSYKFAPRLLFEKQIASLSKLYIELEVQPECNKTQHPSQSTSLAHVHSSPIEIKSHSSLKNSQRSHTLLELLQNSSSDRWVVLGDPGAGKSTTARRLVWQLAKQRQKDPQGGPLPVFADLPPLIESNQHPFQWAQTRFAGRTSKAKAKNFAQQLFKRAQCGQGPGIWLFLDSLDELSVSQAEQLRDRLANWEQDLHKVTIVIFSRSLGYISPGEAFDKNRAQVKKLNLRRQKNLLRSWLKDSNEDPDIRKKIFTSLWSQFKNSAVLKDACRTPFLLSLLAFLTKKQIPKTGKKISTGYKLELPKNRIELYRLGIKTLLQRGHSYHAANGVRDCNGAYDVLAHLALQLQENSGENWPQKVLDETLLDLMDEKKKVRQRFGQHGSWLSPEDFFEEIAEQSGILGPYNIDTNEKAPWRFLHRQFKELLVAEALHEQGDQALIERAKKLDAKDIPRWAESLGFACEMASDPLKVLKQLAEVSQDLALRVLPEIEGVDHVAALNLLLEQGEWDGDYLLDLIRRWTSEGGLPREQARKWLWKQVTPQRSTEELAYFHYALHYLDPKSETLPDREKFFKRCERWPDNGPPQLDWKKIPEGNFQMGAPKEEVGSEDDERPVYSVKLDTFELAATPVSNEQYRVFDNVYSIVNKPELSKHPVTDVSWWQAYLYCHWLGGRLPTEAQWEYACRAGTTTRYWSGDDEGDLAKVGWYRENTKDQTQPVGEKPANPFGLYDMHGNVWEWCQDWYGGYENLTHEGDGLRDVESTESRVIRGGSWYGSAKLCRSAYRLWDERGFRGGIIGFRPARLIT